MKIDLSSFGLLLRNISICIVLPWLVLASTAICSAFMLCPSTLL